MRKQLAPRKDLDDGDAPAWVREPVKADPRVPHCTRCGAEGPQLVCDTCFAREFSGRHIPATKAEAMQSLTSLLTPVVPTQRVDERQELVQSEPVQYHAARFRANGLSEAAALHHALALVERTDHAAECAVCQEHHQVGTRLRERRAESTRLSQRGMEALRPALEREIRRQGVGRRNGRAD